MPTGPPLTSQRTTYLCRRVGRRKDGDFRTIIVRVFPPCADLSDLSMVCITISIVMALIITRLNSPPFPRNAPSAKPRNSPILNVPLSSLG